jgi:hypothetical protein
MFRYRKSVAETIPHFQAIFLASDRHTGHSSALRERKVRPESPARPTVPTRVSNANRPDLHRLLYIWTTWLPGGSGTTARDNSPFTQQILKNP